MSSTTPGQGAADDAAERRQEGGPGATRTPSSAERSAMRTSLAERFAAARGVAEDPVVPRPEATAPAAAAAVPVGRPRSSEVSGGSAAAPRYGVETTARQPAASATRQDAPAATRQDAPAATRQDAPAAARQDAPAAARQDAPAAAGQDAPSAATPQASRPAPAGPRRVRLSLARVDPWSVMKLSFLLSIAVGIGIIVAAAALWLVLDSMQVFADIEELLQTIDSENFLQLMDYLQFDRVISLAAIIAVVDVLLLTALATLGAFLYNIVAALVGGVHLTLTDD